MVIYIVIREKEQRFEAVRGVNCIYQWDLRTVLRTIPPPASAQLLGRGYVLRPESKDANRLFIHSLFSCTGCTEVEKKYTPALDLRE
jgi:hypothetical protein